MSGSRAADPRDLNRFIHAQQGVYEQALTELRRGGSGRTGCDEEEDGDARIMDLIWPGGFVVPSIHVAARLGIVDLIGPEPRTVDELADASKSARTGTPGERTEPEYRALLRRGGFALARVVPTSGPSASLESHVE